RDRKSTVKHGSVISSKSPSKGTDRLKYLSTCFSRERDGLVKHTGGCHCGAVRFEVWSAPDLHVFSCNCSICTKKQNLHFIVPKSQFTLLQGSDNITTYTFNTHMAKHTFCTTCGVQSFYTPRSNPDGFGVTPHCLDPGTVSSVTVEDFCGQNWEESMQKHQTIRSMSKQTTDT
uniref:Centromere protein V-like n=1 Tax=Sinocyclocheilus grahami TaxID=75366 RepID=A0A672SXQ5_SINGR